MKKNWRRIMDLIKRVMGMFKRKKGDGKMEKKLVMISALLVITALVMPLAMAEDNPRPELNIQEGAVLTWDGQIKNMTGAKVYELVDDKPISDWPTWAKVLLVGDCVSVAWSGDKANWQAASVLFGRKLGTISNYLPFIKWDLLDKFDVHFYPAGFYLEKVDTIDDGSRIKFKGATGLSVLNIRAQF